MHCIQSEMLRLNLSETLGNEDTVSGLGNLWSSKAGRLYQSCVGVVSAHLPQRYAGNVIAGTRWAQSRENTGQGLVLSWGNYLLLLLL